MPSNPFTYTGREDDGTGLLYYRARYYDPELEVFISQDPLGDVQRYVGGNPLSFVDPLGLEGICPTPKDDESAPIGGNCGVPTSIGGGVGPQQTGSISTRYGFGGVNNNSPKPISIDPCPKSLFQGGRIPTTRDLQNWAKNQGWQKGNNPSGPESYYDQNNILRLQIKNGSSRTAGSQGPHAEFRNELGQRIDPTTGNPVTRKSIGNHTQIIPYYNGRYNLVP